MQGAALATVIAHGTTMLAGLYILRFRKKILFHCSLHLELWGDSMRRLLHVGLPSALAGSIMPLTQAVLIALLAGYGQEAVAAYGIASRVEAFALIAVMATAAGMSPIIGQNWGALKYARVREVLYMALRFIVLWCLGVAFILWMFNDSVAGFFTENPEVAVLAALYFMIVPWTYSLGTLVDGWSSASNAMGYPRRAFIMVVTRTVALLLPLATLLGGLYGAPGVFAAIALSNVIAGTGAHVINKRLCYKSMQATP
jgi:Na+-driven multidrug efflux pump